MRLADVALLLILPALSAACSRDPAPAAKEVYLIIPAQTDKAGWAVVESAGRDLPMATRMRFGVPALLSDRDSTMILPFAGTCAADAALVAEIDCLARRQGIKGTRCSAHLPG